MAERTLQLLIRAPVEPVARLLGDPAVYLAALPMVLECSSIPPPEDGLIRLRVRVIREFEITLRLISVPGGRIEWHRVEGDLEQVEGSWDLRAGREPDLTEARLDLRVEAGFPLPPEVEENLGDTSLPAAVERLKEHLELRLRGGEEALPPP